MPHGGVWRLPGQLTLGAACLQPLLPVFARSHPPHHCQAPGLSRREPTSSSACSRKQRRDQGTPVSGQRPPRMSGMIEQLVQSKLVLLGEMGSGKTSLVQRFVRGQYFENQVSAGACLGGRRQARHASPGTAAALHNLSARPPARGASLQESTIGASFFTKTIPEKHVKFEIWCGQGIELVGWRPGRGPALPRFAGRLHTHHHRRSNPAGTPRGRSGTTAWPPCTTGAPPPPSSCTTSPTPPRLSAVSREPERQQTGPMPATAARGRGSLGTACDAPWGAGWAGGWTG